MTATTATTATTVRAVRVSASTAIARVLSERGGFVTCIGFYVAVVSVLGSLWRAAAGTHGGTVVGYTAAALTWYVTTSEAVTVSLNIRMIEDIGQDISDGTVVVELLRPVSMLTVRIASEIGRCLPRLAACIAVGIAMSSLIVGAPPDLAAFALAVPSMVLAVSCNIVAQHAFAAAAFWIRDARSSWFLYQKLVFVLGGMLLPLQVLPHQLEAVARLLPFMAMAYAPARLAAGHVEPVLLVVQLGWLAVLLVVARLAFSAGERRLLAVGG